MLILLCGNCRNSYFFLRICIQGHHKSNVLKRCCRGIAQFSQALAENDSASLEGVDRLGMLRNGDALLAGESVFGPGTGNSNTVYNPVDLTASALYNSMHAMVEVTHH